MGDQVSLECVPTPLPLRFFFLYNNIIGTFGKWLPSEELFLAYTTMERSSLGVGQCMSTQMLVPCKSAITNTAL